jgi:hypothetical protein
MPNIKPKLFMVHVFARYEIKDFWTNLKNIRYICVFRAQIFLYVKCYEVAIHYVAALVVQR